MADFFRKPVRLVKGSVAHYVHPDGTVYYRRMNREGGEEVGGLRKLKDPAHAARLFAEVIENHRAAKKEPPKSAEHGIVTAP